MALSEPSCLKTMLPDGVLAPSGLLRASEEDDGLPCLQAPSVFGHGFTRGFMSVWAAAKRARLRLGWPGWPAPRRWRPADAQHQP